MSVAELLAKAHAARQARFKKAAVGIVDPDKIRATHRIEADDNYCGLMPQRRKNRNNNLPPEAAEARNSAMLDAYLRGDTYEDIQEEFHLSHAFIKRIAIKDHWPLRGRPNQYKAPSEPMLKLYNAGVTMANIGKAFGMSRNGVCRRAAAEGWPARPKALKNSGS